MCFLVVLTPARVLCVHSGLNGFSTMSFHRLLSRRSCSVRRRVPKGLPEFSAFSNAPREAPIPTAHVPYPDSSDYKSMVTGHL